MKSSYSIDVDWQSGWKSDLSSMACTLSWYAEELRKANTDQQKRQSQLFPSRTIAQNAKYQYILLKYTVTYVSYL